MVVLRAGVCTVCKKEGPCQESKNNKNMILCIGNTMQEYQQDSLHQLNFREMKRKRPGIHQAKRA